jgi:hypothetical protein
MIYRMLFPTGGGGWLRRYTNFQQQLMKQLWETPDVYPLGPLTLFDFGRSDDASDVLTTSKAYSRARQQDAWRVSDDRVIGGYSESLAHLIRPSEAETDEEDDNATVLPEEGASNFVLRAEEESVEEEDESQLAIASRPHLRWYGEIDTAVGLESSVQRSGFAALRSPLFAMGGANLKGAYTALEVTCRSDGRVYTINLQVSTSLPTDLFQGQIDVPASSQGKWDRLYLPFSEFGFLSPSDRSFANRKKASRTTIHQEGERDPRSRRRRSVQRHSLEVGGAEDEVARLDDKICIESIGFTLMDGQDGPFEFDLAQIRAVNFYEDEAWEGLPRSKSDDPYVRFPL